MHRAALVAGCRRHLIDGLPKAECPVAGGQFGRDGQSARLEVDQQFPPALCALPHAHLEADQFLLALGRRADQHQDALGLWLPCVPAGRHRRPRHTRSAGPTSRAAAKRIVRLPLAPQPRDHRRRQVRGIAAQQRPERLLEIAHRDPAQIEDRQQGIQARRPPRPAWQDRRCKTDALSPLAGAAVAQLHPPHFDRTDPGLDHPLRPQPVPHQALAPIRQLHALHRGQECLGLRDRTGQAAGERRFRMAVSGSSIASD